MSYFFNHVFRKKNKLPTKAEILKQKANSRFEEQNYLEAIEFYNQGILIAPDSPILFGNRAAALMKRNWDGDMYMAMLDCYKALSLDCMHLKSHFRLAKCLYELKWHCEAQECLITFCKRFPEYAKTCACENLIKEINISLNNSKKKQEKDKYVKKNKKLKTKLKSYTAYMTGTSESKPYDEGEEDFYYKEINENESDRDSENENTKKYTKDTFFKSEDESSDSSISSTSSETNNKYNQIKSKITDTKKTTCEDSDTDHKIYNTKSLLKIYKLQKLEANDFKSRYCGHCNVATDIKEANFLGE